MSQSKGIPRAMVKLAMLRLKQGKLDEAWSDLLACHRLARLIGQGPQFAEGLAACEMDRIACAGDQALLQNATLNAAQIARIRDDLARLSPMPKMADKVEIGSRFVWLDVVCSIARGGNEPTFFFDAPQEMKKWLDDAGRESLDYNLILRTVNRGCDRAAGALRNPSRPDAWRAVLEIEKDAKKLMREAYEDGLSWHVADMLNDRRREASLRMGNLVVGRLSSNLSDAINDEDRANMHFEMTKLGFALVAYRTDHGAYPDRLSGLVPRYVAKVPTDIFANDAPLHYKPEGSGFLLYSIGLNGRNAEYHLDLDDLSIRMP
jgi:hypothetical protein